jgi:hypothetical protein
VNQARGFVTVTGPDGRSVTRETFTCCHCNGVDFTPAPNAPEVGFCHGCFARECVTCAKKLGGRCVAFERRIDQYERRQRMLVAVTG